MTFRQAKKLHNEDEVTIKETGEVVEVITAYTEPDSNGKPAAWVEVCSPIYGYVKLHHAEIK
jgi:hypothetical protein